MSVAALFVMADGPYPSMGVECFDIERDARSFDLSCPVVAHPPCRGWSRLRAFAKPRPDERDLAVWAVWVVRHCGGVLEHPSGSSLWRVMGLPHPGSPVRDEFGVWCLPVSQKWWGHRAEKRTWLYVCGIEPAGLPPVPLVLGEAERVVSGSRQRHPRLRRDEVSKAERMESPLAFAAWLVELASRCGARGGLR